jgi:hypothetical protein
MIIKRSFSGIADVRVFVTCETVWARVFVTSISFCKIYGVFVKVFVNY